MGTNDGISCGCHTEHGEWVWGRAMGQPLDVTSSVGTSKGSAVDVTPGIGTSLGTMSGISCGCHVRQGDQ